MSEVPKPTPEDMARDLAAELALCESADDPGRELSVAVREWARPGMPPLYHASMPERQSLAEAQADASRLLAARRGWPAAVRRARHAEAVNADLLAVCKELAADPGLYGVLAAAYGEERGAWLANAIRGAVRKTDEYPFRGATKMTTRPINVPDDAQVADARRRWPGLLLLFRVPSANGGAEMAAVGPDALEVAAALNAEGLLADFAGADPASGRQACCWLPTDRLDAVLRRLLDGGHRVAVMECC